MRLAAFISPHGFGHAARAAAVITALRKRRPRLDVTLYTRVPSSFFEDSHMGPFTAVDLDCDLGMVQRSAIDEDLPATLERLATLPLFDESRVRALAATVQARGCEAILCDISPLGLAVARAAGLPSLLVENFTWDWIYDGYVARDARFGPFASRMREAFALADWRAQTEPVCHPVPGATAIPVVSRAPREDRARVRARLALRPDTPAILITGGILPGSRADLARLLRRVPDCDFVVIGGAEAEARDGAVWFLPSRSAFYHPDLVHACDVVVAKLGYSTVAEVYHAGTRMAYLTRPQFRESPILEAFVRARIPSQWIEAQAWESGAWLEDLPHLLAQPRVVRRERNGAEVLAEAIDQTWPAA